MGATQDDASSLGFLAKFLVHIAWKLRLQTKPQRGVVVKTSSAARK